MGNLAHAYWIAPNQGLAILNENWLSEEAPPLRISSDKRKVVNIRRASDLVHADLCGFYVENGDVTFVVFPSDFPHLKFGQTGLYVAGDFNQWGAKNQREGWELQETDLEGETVWALTIPAGRVFEKFREPEFKFVTREWLWLNPDYHAPNLSAHKDGVCNYRIHPGRTGDHCFMFDVEGPRALTGEYRLRWGDSGESVPLEAGAFFYTLSSEHPMGARIEGHYTVFRLFAPRARSAWVDTGNEADGSDFVSHEMTLLEDGMTWEARVSGNLHGAYYYLRVGGQPIGGDAQFDENRRLLDPWALVTAGHDGPGIVWDQRKLPKVKKRFEPPRWNDLVIVEAHVRDLVKHAPIDIPAPERLGFTGLRKWIETEGNYLKELGVNAVELQPIQQFDSPKREDYHWGYMTTSYFSPCAHYGMKPLEGSQVQEFRELIEAFHRQNLAVILDVVYNHVGEPNVLVWIDKQYYFDVTPKGELINWSGCGNTLRADAAMAKRLIIESLSHLVEAFDVDGFRFDLAELIGVPVLKELEHALKAIKPEIILIAEPWSFRGHIAKELKHTGWAFWNDGFREFMVRYLKGKGDSEGIRYYMSGCLSHLTAWPAQSVNYVESHDDRSFLDKITERPNKDGSHPTEHDRYRCHLMVGILMCSLGVPMLHSGQDFMRSKHGKNNTYLDGDENALDYNRIKDHAHTHWYFKQWIAFRNSEFGRVFRPWSRPSDGYTRYWQAGESSATVAWWNGDGQMGPCEVLFAVNPHLNHPARVHCGGMDPRGWTMVADRHNFNMEGLGYSRLDEHGNLEIESLGLCLLIKKNG